MHQFSGAYIDDILIYTKILEEKLQALRKVYNKLLEESLFSLQYKCTWAHPEVEYFGFIVFTHCIWPQRVKLLAILHWTPPCSVTNVTSFLGLCGFYQRFVADYATFAATLTDLMQKDKDWAWLPVQKHAFETLKARPM